ncbi:MAG: isocitrate dehydrogenase (NADP(+)) [Elusimicrobia bacterium]|nr:isocitrate dehydrogenase (NADP(+)) [Elusimicrobiota bacterium]
MEKLSTAGAVPKEGQPITLSGGRLQVPARPVVPFIEGDGIGTDIWPAARLVLDAAVAKAYGRERRIAWLEVLAGEKAAARLGPGRHLPEETLAALRKYRVSIKGPLTTPVGGGIRSLNVTIRQKLDLYACVRPVRWFPGVPAPVRHPEKLDVVIFRENTEDVYAGIEWASGSPEAGRVADFLAREMGVRLADKSAIGIKPMSPGNSKRLVRAAIRYALAKKLPSVTIVHKGNIMKFTEGGFRDWAYELVRDEFPQETVTEAGGTAAEGRLLIKDRIADSMFQQVLLRPDEYSVLATPNLTGDYLSDACAAQVGGLGMAPGANIGDGIGVFEATHGSAPKYAGKDVSNPSSLILSGALMLEFMGWQEAAAAVLQAMSATFAAKTVTYDLARQMPDAKELKCSQFADAVAANL